MVDFERRPINPYLPPFVPGPELKQDIRERTECCWIVVSGYQPERAYLVYSFFLDIGHIVDKSFTAASAMHIRYFCLMDSEVALSYDKQRIGYAADIFVRVQLAPKAEPVPLPMCVIDIEEEQPKEEPQQPAPAPAPAAAPKRKSRQVAVRKMSFIQWLKRKISYIFYLN